MPPGFDFSTADQGNRKPVAAWNKLGVRLMDGARCRISARRR